MDVQSNDGQSDDFIPEKTLDSDEEFSLRRATSLEPFSDMLQGMYKFLLLFHY